MKRSYLAVFLTVFLFLIASSTWAVPVTFSQLTGLTGGSPAQTAVFNGSSKSKSNLT